MSVASVMAANRRAASRDVLAPSLRAALDRYPSTVRFDRRSKSACSLAL
jgi:hypothetical protein